jgi:hypothetical protein
MSLPHADKVWLCFDLPVKLKSGLRGI